MPQKEYEIAFKLAASKAGSFSSAFNAAGQSVNTLADQIAKMDAAASSLGGLIEARNKLSETAKASKNALLAYQGLRDKSQELAKKTEALSNEYSNAQAELKRLEQKVNSSEEASDDLTRAYQAQKKKVQDLGKALEDTRTEQKNVENATKKAQAQYKRTRKTVENQRLAIGRLDKEMGTAGQSTASLSSRQKMLADASSKATARLEKQAKIQAKIDKIEPFRAGTQMLDSGVNTVGRTIGGYAARQLTNAGALVGAGNSLVKIGTEYQSAMNQMQAATGLSAKEMQGLAESARSIYKLGLGESFSDVTRSMSVMRQVTGLTGKELESAAKNALLLSKTFDMDVNESARASSALMKNFGISGQKAYDLIAYAAQNGANKNGDLLDTLNEYSVQYKALGFTAEEFTAHLVQGAKDGSFSIDKVGDAMKEFNIRAKDGSKSSMEAFEMLGLNATKATQMFAQGGEKAQAAFMEVIKRLEEMDDPVRKNAIGVALFGSQFEDLEKNAIRGFAKIKSSAVDAKGTMDTIADLQTQDLSNQLIVLSRQFQDTLTPAANEASKALAGKMPEIESSLKEIAPYINQLGQAFINALPSIMEWASRVLQSITKVGVWLAENFDKIAAAAGLAAKAFFGLKIATGVSSAFFQVTQSVLLLQKGFAGLQGGITAVGGALKFLSANPIVLIVGALATLAIAGNYIIKNWDTIKAKASELYQSFKANLVDAMAPVIAQFEAIGHSVQAVFTNIVGFVKNVFTGQWSAAWENVKGIFSNVFNALSGIVKAPMNALIALVNSVIKSINNIGSVKLPKIMGGGSIGLNIPEIPLLAEGGIIKSPTLACVAEAGEPEAVIPLSKLNQMLDPMAAPPESSSLSRASSALFGSNAPVASPGSVSAGSAPLTINISPTINVQGADANPGDIADRIVEVLRQKLPGEMQRILDQQSRLSFA